MRKRERKIYLSPNVTTKAPTNNTDQQAINIYIIYMITTEEKREKKEKIKSE